MRAGLLAVLAAALFGCAPRYGNGHLRCAPTGKLCPDGYHCAWNGSCWHDGEDPPLGGDFDLGDVAPSRDGQRPGSDGSAASDGSVVSGGSDGGTVAAQDLASQCLTGDRPTNFEGCQLPPSEGAWTTAAGSSQYYSSTGFLGHPGALFAQSNGPMVRVVQLTTFKVPAGSELWVVDTEGNPLLVVADTVEIAGTIRLWDQDSSRSGCAAGGGQGVGTGGTAGPGPACPNGPSGCAGIVPLVGGCRGNAGTFANGTLPSGKGGWAGGALQITARTSITVTGTINAGGFQGGGGLAYDGNQLGGYAGGSGGAIFLEAPTVTLASSARLCANGAGGGGGSSTDAWPGNPPDVTCGDTQASGGSAVGTGGQGGAGGHRSHPAGYVGSSGSSGGSGGGVGRIRIRSQNANPSGSALVTPAPLEG